MAEKSLTPIRNELRNILDKVRTEATALEKKRATLDPRWSNEAKAAAMAGWRSEASSKLAALTASVSELTQSALGAQDYWSTREYLRRQPLIKSTGGDSTQNQILEELRRINTREDLRRLSAEEMVSRADDAIAGQRWGELNLLLVEAEDRKTKNPGEHAPLLLATVIEQTSPPEVAGARETIAEIRYLAQWISSATSALVNGTEDYGFAQEQSFLATAEKESGNYSEAKERMRPFMEAPKTAA